MTKQQLLALLREAYRAGSVDEINCDYDDCEFIGEVERTNRVGDLELPVLGEWVSVEDGLPVGLGEVQVWVNGEDCFAVAWISTWSTGEHEWVFQNTLLDSCGDCITHWMPLPQPPEGV